MARLSPVAASITCLALASLMGFTLGLNYEPYRWNTTCVYRAFGVPTSEFFTGTTPDGWYRLFPLARTLARVGYQAQVNITCFGPNEKYVEALVMQKKKLPCKYTLYANKTVDYWEEQACPVTLDSNCYCYAINRTIGGFCIPGMSSAAGQSSVRDWDCETMKKRLIMDGATPVDRTTVYTKKPKGTHYIGVRISLPGGRYGNDFHFWRLDDNKAWSWKAGFTFARNSYKNGSIVRDIEHPEMAKLYPTFCGYYDVNSKTHKLGKFPLGTSNSDVPDRYNGWLDNHYKTRIDLLPKWTKGWYTRFSDIFVKYSMLDAFDANGAPGPSRRIGCVKDLPGLPGASRILASRSGCSPELVG